MSLLETTLFTTIFFWFFFCLCPCVATLALSALLAILLVTAPVIPLMVRDKGSAGLLLAVAGDVLLLAGANVPWTLPWRENKNFCGCCLWDGGSPEVEERSPCASVECDDNDTVAVEVRGAASSTIDVSGARTSCGSDVGEDKGWAGEDGDSG